MKKTDKELEARDANRNIRSELLGSDKEMRGKKTHSRVKVEATELAISRQKVGLLKIEAVKQL